MIGLALACLITLVIAAHTREQHSRTTNTLDLTNPAARRALNNRRKRH